MSTFVTLSSGRICLRRWREEDREAFAVMNADARVMEFFAGRLSRAERRDGRWYREAYQRMRFWLMGNRGPWSSAFHRLRRICGSTIQRPFYSLRGNRLASRLRALGIRLRDGGGPVGACLRLRDPRAFRSRLFYVCDEPPLASSDGTAWNAPRSCGRF